jgi:hypothetical protein
MSVRRGVVKDSAQCFIRSGITILYKALSFVCVKVETADLESSSCYSEEVSKPRSHVRDSLVCQLSSPLVLQGNLLCPPLHQRHTLGQWKGFPLSLRSLTRSIPGCVDPHIEDMNL